MTSGGGPPPAPSGERDDSYWRENLAPEEYHILREAGTEEKGSGEYDKHYPKQGYYACRGCDLPLYSFAAKFDSGCGWPAFDRCYASNEFNPEKVESHIVVQSDSSTGEPRAEISCRRCRGHLGHVFFNEGGTVDERHCVNSRAVRYRDGDSPVSLEGAKEINKEFSLRTEAGADLVAESIKRTVKEREDVVPGK